MFVRMLKRQAAFYSVWVVLPLHLWGPGGWTLSYYFSSFPGPGFPFFCSPPPALSEARISSASSFLPILSHAETTAVR
jgi:hypothetical protein